MNALLTVYLNLKLNGLLLRVKLYIYPESVHNTLNFIFSNSGNIIENEIIELSKLLLRGNESFECIADNGIGDILRKTISIYLRGITFAKCSD